MRMKRAKWMLGSLGAFLWAFLAIGSTRMKDYRKKLAFYAAGILVFFVMANFAVPNSAMDRRTARKASPTQFIPSDVRGHNWCPMTM